MKKILLALVVMIGLASNAFATLPDVNTSPNEQWRVEVNQSGPAATRTQLGSRLQGPLQSGATTVAAQLNTSDANPVGKCNGDASTYTTPTTKAYLKTTGAAATWGESYCLGNGYQNQELVFQLTSGSKTFTITPYTKTGFSNIAITAAKGAVTLQFLETTDGWVIKGSTPSGVTIN